MREYCHRLDPTRLMSVASSSGPHILVTADVAGYNYIIQNPIEQHRAQYPERVAVGSEETSGCGTRGVYFTEPGTGRKAAINRGPQGPDSLYNCIGRGMKFYEERPWLSGMFYWTGFDYRGEPDPLVWPATLSEFGILDYCGFPKDEAWYLRAWWTEEPVLHILPYWNLEGHEGEVIPVWVYSNCDEVALTVNGKSLGRKKMPRYGYLEWKAAYKPGKVVATGYKKGRKVMTETVWTAGAPARLETETDRIGDFSVVNVTVLDVQGHFVPTACIPVTLTLEGEGCIVGGGNGDPAYHGSERPSAGAKTFTLPSFNGRVQFLLRGKENVIIKLSI
jgi:beta-galactosidase